MSRAKERSFQRQCQSLWGRADPGISTTMARTSWRETAMWGLFACAHGASQVALRVKGWSFVKEPQSLSSLQRVRSCPPWSLTVTRQQPYRPQTAAPVVWKVRASHVASELLIACLAQAALKSRVALATEEQWMKQASPLCRVSTHCLLQDLAEIQTPWLWGLEADCWSCILSIEPPWAGAVVGWQGRMATAWWGD